MSKPGEEQRQIEEMGFHVIPDQCPLPRLSDEEHRQLQERLNAIVRSMHNSFVNPNGMLAR